ncbi:MAG: alpha/beta hydrolase [Proteobacteria bacterium]|nr:alpha/beta hydrolase [Pseudomonadota bacterium]MBS0574787.1 alpha/beta hydrolase [Pseudomonadota bacterium]
MTDTPDYKTLIDAETWDFIRETERWYPPETATFTVAEQRRVYDEMCRAFNRPYPPDLKVADERLGGVPCRIYTPGRAGAAGATVLYLHGGGFVVGGLESHDPICAEIATATGYRVVSADYRLAPEHRHPAQFDDALAAARATAARWPGRLVLAGDSAGGNLSAAVAHRLRGSETKIAGVVLVYPGLGGPLDRGSAVIHAHAPMLSRDDVLFYHDIRFGKGKGGGAHDPTASPLADRDFSGLPPTLIHVAECDPLADDGRLYADAIHAAGGSARCVTDRGLVHGHLRARHSVARSRESFAAITAAIAALGRGEVPWRAAL